MAPRRPPAPPGDEPKGRPWSVAAAAEPLPPLRPPAPRAAASRGAERVEGRSWALTAVVGVAVAAALAVVAVSRLHLGSTPSSGLVINGLAAVRDAGVPAHLPLGHFPASASHVEVGCDYAGAATGDVVDFTISVAPAQPGAPPLQLPRQSHTFTDADTSSGHITISISAAAGGFAPGTYSVAASRNGRSLHSTQFTVDPAPPRPTPPTPVA